MRFAELQLIRYGRFQDCSLSFAHGDCDLPIILGPNEAGKSTTLAAVSDLLFGFGPRTRFGFKFDQKLLRVGALIEADGARLEVRRRKGNVDTLLGADDQPIDPALLGARLSGQSRESFERMFGLDHARLRQGGKLILEAKDDVGAAIFAAGSGLVRVAKLCEELDREAAEIWLKKGGDNRRFNAALTAYQVARVDLKEAEVRPATWAKARRELKAIEAELETLKAERTALARLQRIVQRKQLVLRPLAERTRALTRLSELGCSLEITAEATGPLETALELLQNARTEAGLAGDQIERLERELDAERPDPAVLAAGPEADALRELKGAVDDGAAALPALDANLRAVAQRVSETAAEIGWPQESARALKARLPGRPAIAELRDLIERRGAIDELLRSTGEALEDATREAGRVAKAMSELPARTDVRPLQDLLREVRTAGLTQATATAVTTQRELEELLGSRMRALAPWQGDLAALRTLALPAETDVARVMKQLEQAQDALRREGEGCARAQSRLEQLNLERKHKLLSHPTPSPSDQDAAREAREASWAPLKRHIRGDAALDHPLAAVELYEQAVVVSDRVADERFAGAEHAGGLAAHEREIEKCELELAQADRRRTAAAEAESAGLADYRRLVDPLGITLTPSAFDAWRTAYDEALHHADALDLASQDVETARRAEDAARLALARALGRRDPQDEPATLQRLWEETEQRVEDARESESRERELRAELSAAEAALDRARHSAGVAETADAAWTLAWKPALERAALPVDAAVAAARARLELIERVRQDVDKQLDLESEAAGMHEAQSTFEKRVAAAAGAAGLPQFEDAAKTYAGLQAACAMAGKQAGRAETLGSQLDAALLRQAAAKDNLARARAVLAPLIAASADPDDPSSIRTVLNRAGEAAGLRRRLLQLEDEILSQGEGRTLEALIEEVSGAQPDALAAEAETLAGELDRLNPQVDAKSEARQAALTAFEALGDGPDAAIAAFAMAEARSEMAFQADLYIRKRAEARLLKMAIERYRQEKQGPLLARASALFRTLTLGAFSSLMVDYDEDAPALAGVRSDGAAVVPVEGMSEGTVDQLFLALRIAAVEQAVAQGVKLPFLADDLFINFDDERAAAGFRVLADLGRKTQVLFFTHHSHLADVADKALRPAKVSVCGLDRVEPVLAAVPVSAE